MGDENLKTSLPVVMLGVTVRRYTTTISNAFHCNGNFYFNAKGNTMELGKTGLLMKIVYSETCCIP